jgi:hypothetical protein
MWSVATTDSGIRRWQKTKKVSPIVTKVSAARGEHKIAFCEPYVVRDRSGLKGSIRFAVSDKFFPTLLRAPRSLHVRRVKFDIGNAYVFGRRFPLGSYTRLGYCGNDGAQIGFVSLDDFKATRDISAIVLEEYGFNRSGNITPWDDRSALRRVRRIIPHILFMGGTDGGDVGATLYAHQTAGRIDGLIIDNEYFFRTTG